MGTIAHQEHERTAANNLIKLITMTNHETSTIGGGMYRLVKQFHTVDGLAAEPAKEVIVISRHVDHARATRGKLKEFLYDRLVRSREADTPLHGNQVNNVSDQIEGFAANIIEKIQQIVCLAVRRTQMHIGYEYTPVVPHVVSRHFATPVWYTVAKCGDRKVTGRRQFYDHGLTVATDSRIRLLQLKT
ncbi:hypothetical protein GCM10011362_15130 [Marinobacter halophilus]|nr:hypothetical protein GCM10011362_15130 [Marinobacter halophilus]